MSNDKKENGTNGLKFRETEILTTRLGMSLDEFSKVMEPSDDELPNRLGMSVENFKNVITDAE